jgi:hypothetical protein
VDVEPAGSECVADRLATFPFDGPTRRGDLDVVRVRWRPGEPVERLEELHERENGLRALAPPYYRWSRSGDALVLDEDLQLEGGRIRIRPLPESDVVAGTLDAAEAWARKLSCPADSLELVRTILVFADGELEVRRTIPDTPCVEDRAVEAAGWMAAQRLRATRIAYLAERAGRNVDREDLLRDVWGYRGGVVTRSVDNTVLRLRAKIEPDPARPRHVFTVQGTGYRFEP